MIEIKEIRPDHYFETAKLHKELLPWSFMSQAGIGFLKEFYRGLMDSKTGFGYVAVEESRVVGCVMGTYDSPNLMKSVLKANFTGILLALSVVLLKDISKIRMILDILRVEKKMQSTRLYPKAESLIIAISPDIKKGTLFYKLIYQLNRHFLLKGIVSYSGRVLSSNPIFQVFKRMPALKVMEEVNAYGLQWTLYVCNVKEGLGGIEN